MLDSTFTLPASISAPAETPGADAITPMQMQNLAFIPAQSFQCEPARRVSRNVRKVDEDRTRGGHAWSGAPAGVS
jgi:hypothetical protein